VSETRFFLNPVDSAVGAIALVTIDNGEDHTKPTALGRSAFESAIGVVEELESGDWAAMVVTGKPYVFCVGADIKEFPTIRSGEAAAEASRVGQDLFSRIRALPFPTVAAINGACLGGGLELALHCSARTVASNVRHLGFPEVFLGIFPAWGGTQLTPRLVGPEGAIKLIVTNPMRQNKLLSAPEALELGLVDRVLEPVEFVDESLQFAVDLVRESMSARADGQTNSDQPVQQVGQTKSDESDQQVGLTRSDQRLAGWEDADNLLRKARNRVEDAVHGATRAPYVALELIAGAREWSLEEGYRAEEEAFAELMPSRQARASIYAFDLVERRAKRGVGIPDARPRRIEKVGIVGAGLMATQLAALFVRRLEVPVVLRDLDQGTVDRAVQTVREEVGARKPFLTTLVSGGTGWEHFEGCDLVLEAVFEELAVKRQVFAAVREVAPGALLATNTSSLSVEEMGADVGLHFFNPVAVLPLVEIVRTPETTDEQLATAWDVVQKLRKRGVLVGDAPAFVVNRVLTRMTTVLMDALENGNTVEETDEAVLELGLPMAPSVLLQMVGPRVANHVLETLHGAYPDRFPLSATLANYAEGRDEIAVSGDRRRSVEQIREDVLAAIADEIRHLLDERVVAEAADVDTCLILGAGWPFFMGGVTMYLDQVGISERVAGSTLAEYGKVPV
jgi:3-hydroxyacyl-CoA dehydrogenase/enoyl-CoA hydratase/carnithine racemase